MRFGEPIDYNTGSGVGQIMSVWCGVWFSLQLCSQAQTLLTLTWECLQLVPQKSSGRGGEIGATLMCIVIVFSLCSCCFNLLDVSPTTTLWVDMLNLGMNIWRNAWIALVTLWLQASVTLRSSGFPNNVLEHGSSVFWRMSHCQVCLVTCWLTWSCSSVNACRLRSASRLLQSSHQELNRNRLGLIDQQRCPSGTMLSRRKANGLARPGGSWGSFIYYRAVENMILFSQRGLSLRDLYYV